MKTNPIIFSGPMVRAILDGRKTQTRRMVSKQNSMTSCPFDWHDLDSPQTFADHGFPDEHGHYLGGYLHAPISNGPPGHDKTAIFRIYPRYAADGQWDEEPERDYCPPPTRLWVRETWAVVQTCDYIKPSELPHGTAAWYPATPSTCIGLGKMRPSIFMPRWASRITLEIEAVRAERLQDINTGDCISEGIWVEPPTGATQQKYPADYADWSEKKREEWANSAARAMYMTQCYHEGELQKAYSNLWDSIHGEGAWDENPYVWVLDFKRLIG